MLHGHEDLILDPQHPHKKAKHDGPCACNPRASVSETGGFLDPMRDQISRNKAENNRGRYLAHMGPYTDAHTK